MSFNIEDKINETISKALHNLDIKILKSVLSEDLIFESFLIDVNKMNKDECVEFFTYDFSSCPNPSGHNTSIVDYNGHKRVAINCGVFSVVFEMEIEDDKIHHLSLNPYPSFSPQLFGMQFPHIFNVALRHVDKYFKDLTPSGWAWLQTYPYEIRFQDLCIAYKTHVLSIMAGIYLPDSKDGKRYFTDEQQLQNMLRECKENNLTPCLFLLYPDGRRYTDGHNLVDPTTLEPIDLDNITDDSNGIMSPWEIKCLGVRRACEYIYSLGCTDIQYCDVLTVDPQLYFTYNGESCYAIVRSVPCGKSGEKFVINDNTLANLSGLKGYFIDVRMNSLFGGTGMFDDKVLYRGMLSVQRYEGEAPVSNILFNQLELKPISDAVKEYEFIEMESKNCINLVTGK